MSITEKDDRHDDVTTVQDLKNVVRQFVSERNWEKFHNPKNLAMSLAIEAAELMEHFQWRTLEESGEVIWDKQNREQIAEELADCLAYALGIANVMNLDLSTALRAKMERNALKYPVDKSAGKWQRPE
jgi:NTP pyrophosphatase (non-canonical NTP hydrolase)